MAVGDSKTFTSIFPQEPLPVMFDASITIVQIGRR